MNASLPSCIHAFPAHGLPCYTFQREKDLLSGARKKLRRKAVRAHLSTRKIFWALPFFLSKTFFSFEEGCAFVECALMVEPGSWESLLSQMADYIVNTGRSPAFFKSFFFLVEDIRVFGRGGRIETGTGLAGIELAMSDDPRLRINLMQQGEDLVEDDHLLGRAVVLVLVLGTAGVATLETDPY